jgi:hypothetical protein
MPPECHQNGGLKSSTSRANKKQIAYDNNGSQQKARLWCSEESPNNRFCACIIAAGRRSEPTLVELQHGGQTVQSVATRFV